jgi:hypothetical protein
MADPAPPRRVRWAEPVETPGYTVCPLSYECDEGVGLRAALYLPRARGPFPGVIYLTDDVPAEGPLLPGGGEVDLCIRRGFAVLVPEVRGLNDSAPLEDTGLFEISGYHTRRVNDAVAIGRPLLGQRVTDVLGAVSVLDEREEVAGGPVIVGDGAGALWGLYAAALDERVASAAARAGLASYQHFIDDPCPTWIQSDRMSTVVVPGALEWFDLPDVASMVAPRPLRLSGLVYGSNRPLSADELTEAYARTRRRYQALGAGDGLELFVSDDLSDWAPLRRRA